MIEENDFPKIRDYVIKILPEILRQEPEIATVIEGILAEQFPRRDEFARLLAELAEHRQETRQNFEQVDRRFEQVDQRFEDMHQTQLGMKRDIAKLQHGQDMIIKRLDDQEKWLRYLAGDLRNIKGQDFEDLVAGALRYGLKNPDISPDKLRLRQKLVDTEGQIFKPGFSTEVDLIVENDRVVVVEVKASARVNDVTTFALKVDLVAAQNPARQVEGVLISLAPSDKVRQYCAEYGLTLVE